MTLGKTEKNGIELLCCVFRGSLHCDIGVSEEEYLLIFQELQQHAVAAIPAELLSSMSGLPEDIREQWKRVVLQQIYSYAQYIHAQNVVVSGLKIHNIPFVILKGTSASCYYPNPQYRAMGDIDIITRRGDIDQACTVLEQLGYSRLQIENDFGRTIKYVKGDMEVEVHRYYASLNDPEKAEYLDKLILDNIREGETKLPDNINGLVLLEHIGDHLEHGLGLRQIIDWMMYVKNCLGDEEWESWFKDQTENIGLNKLAVTVTRMCQIYLGLDERITWCKKANVKTCDELMAYIMASGNFGRKEKNIQKRETIEAMTNHQSFLQMIRLLQKYGEFNWKLLQNYRFLKPFAWIYQIGHSVRKRIENRTSIGEFAVQLQESKARRKLFDDLGVKQYAKGLAVRNGEHFEVKKSENV